MTRMGVVTAVFSTALFAGSGTAADFGSATTDIAPVCRAWEVVATPNGGKGSDLRAVDTVDPSNAWVVGHAWAASPRGAPSRPGPPGDRPVSLSATPIGARRIALKWLPGKNDAARQTYFVIERCASEVRACQPFTVIGKVSGRETSFLDSGLRAATAYTYRVYAVNDAGASSATGPTR